MIDQDEQQRIRDHFVAEQGKAVLAEQAYGELENARNLGNDSAVLRATAALHALGYHTAEERAHAAKARRELAEAQQREDDRVRENRGEAAARDDHDGGPVTQRAGVVNEDGGPASRPVLHDRGDHQDGSEKNVDERKTHDDDGEGEDSKAAARKRPPAGRTTRAGKQTTAAGGKGQEKT